MEDKKPRSDSKLDGLSESQRGELVRLLVDGCSYREALEWLDAECMTKSNLSSLSAFYNRHVVPLIKERRDFAAMQAQAIVTQIGGVDWDKASVERVRNLAFRELNRENPDVETVEKLGNLILKNRQLEFAREKLTVSIKSKIEAGLDALFEEIKGNPRAEKLFAELKEVVSKA